jgi:hypothetical protein
VAMKCMDYEKKIWIQYNNGVRAQTVANVLVLTCSNSKTTNR